MDLFKLTKRSRKGRSYRHDELRNQAISWLANLNEIWGIRFANEVQLADRYIVDACAIARLQFSENKHIKFDNNKSLKKQNAMSFVVESKISRSDFLAKFSENAPIERKTPIVNVHYLVAEEYIVRQSELPEFWGLLEPNKYGLKLIKRPIFCPMPENHIEQIAYKILWAGYGNRGRREDREFEYQKDKL